MKNVLFVILGLIVMTTQGFGQDKKAGEILKKLTEQTKAYKSIKVGFTYRMQNEAAGLDEKMEGVLATQGENYRLQIAGQDIISDGQTVWTYIEEINEVQINLVSEDEDAITPKKLLGNYYENYKAKYEEKITIKGRAMDVLELIPNEGKKYKKILLTIDKAKNQIYSMQILDKNDNIFSYEVKEFLNDLAFGENEFIFDADKYEDLEIVDMR
ncbi:MAG: outer membrane lipoprotein carrier protein LolA [Bacteroidales bacterium]|nr:outer membrane lipoprotein carrier protein LolA [Bacteroidales bacterium]